GASMTSVFEQGYSVPNTTANGFVDALHSWRLLRTVTSTEAAWTAANMAGGGNFARSWRNYVADCAARAIEVGSLPIDTVRQTALIHEALAVGNETMTTVINTNGSWTFRNCKAAHAALLPYSRETVAPAVRAVLQDYYAKPGTLDTTPFTTRLADLHAIMGTGGVSENDMVVAFLVAALYEQGIAHRHILDGRATYAQVIHDAIRQRNVQWSAQGDLFSHYVQPVLTFVEGFFYATFPLMLVFLVMSTNGMAVFTKFLGLGLWIQFWFPISSIVHLFTYMSVENAVQNIVNAGIPPTSFAGIAMADGVVDKWLSVSGLFASAIPVLSLFLITGSVYAFQGIASSVGGPDTITEKNAAPDTYAAAPVTQGLPRFEESQLRGRASPGAVETLPSYTLAHDRSGTVRTAERESEGAREAFTSALSNVTRTSSGSRSSSDAAASVRSAVQASDSHTQGFLSEEGSSFVRDFAQRHNVAESTVRQLAINGALGGGTGGRSGPAVNGSGSFTGSNAHSGSSDQSTSLQDQFNRSVRQNEGFSDSLTESLARDLSRTNTNSAWSSTENLQSRELRQSAEDFLAAERSYEEAVSDQQSLGAQQRLDTPFLARQIASDPAQFENLSRALAQRGLLGEATRTAERWMTAGHFPPDTEGRRQAIAGAGLAAMDKAGMTDALAGMLRPWGLYVPDIGAPEPIGAPIPDIAHGEPVGMASSALAEEGPGSSTGATSSLGSGDGPPAARAASGVMAPAFPPAPTSPTGQEVGDFFEDIRRMTAEHGDAARHLFDLERSRDRQSSVPVENPSRVDVAERLVENLLPDGSTRGTPGGRYEHATEVGLPEPHARYYSEQVRNPGSEAALSARQEVVNSEARPESDGTTEEVLRNLDAAAQRTPPMAEQFLQRAATLNRNE
ncbi:MAG: conjugal transfer protein TraG N-terminal domain-containing protein, partial [Pseudomonadota bacterium]